MSAVHTENGRLVRAKAALVRPLIASLSAVDGGTFNQATYPIDSDHFGFHCERYDSVFVKWSAPTPGASTLVIEPRFYDPESDLWSPFMLSGASVVQRTPAIAADIWVELKVFGRPLVMFAVNALVSGPIVNCEIVAIAGAVRLPEFLLN